MKLIKYITLSLVFCLIGIYAYPQSNTAAEIHRITLKDGSVFEGVIKKYVEGEKLILQLSPNINKTIKDKHIKKIALLNGISTNETNDIPTKINDNQFTLSNKLYFEANYAWLLGRSAYAENADFEEKVKEIDRGMGLQLVGGYQLNQWIGAGVGVGADYYYWGSGETILPVFADLRGHLTKKAVSLIYKAQAGYGFILKDDDLNLEDAVGGVMLYPAIGLYFNTNSNIDFTLDFGYKYQQANYVYNINERDIPRGWNLAKVRVENDLEYNRFAVRASIVF